MHLNLAGIAFILGSAVLAVGAAIHDAHLLRSEKEKVDRFVL